MHELTRRAYLDAMGIASYVSRRPAPGAAATQKLCVVKTAQPQARSSPIEHDKPGKSRVSIAQIESRKTAQAKAPATSVQAASKATPVRPFHLVAFHCGKWLWLEEQPQGLALMDEQVQLVAAASFALGWSKGKPPLADFKWPIHNNRQLDLGEDAARSSVGAFIARLVDEVSATGIVLLGEAAARALPDQLFAQLQTVMVPASADILANPELKKQLWSQLRPFANRT